MKKKNKKITKIVMGTLGVASILAIVPACVVSCGSPNTSTTTTANNTNNNQSKASSSSSTSATPNVPTPIPGRTNLTANITPSKDNKVLGVMEKSNEFGFGSSVTLNANFTEPTVQLATGQTKKISVSYAWYFNGKIIDNQANDTYAINCFNQSGTYQVDATYTINVIENNKTIYTNTKTVSSSITLTVNTSDLSLSLSYGKNETSTISDYGTYNFTPNITANFGKTSSDELTLTPNDFPSGWTLNYLQVGAPSSVKSSLPTGIDLNNAINLTTSIDITNSYPIQVSLLKNDKEIVSSNVINVCGLLNANGKVDVNSTLLNASLGQLINSTNNEYAFGSQVKLISNLTAPTFSLATNQELKLTPTYTWMINGETISNANSSSYTINNSLTSATYTVTVSYAWEIINSDGSALANPIKGVLTYSKSITLNVSDNNIKLTLNDTNLTNEEITNLGNQSLSASVSVSFDNNKTYQTLAPSVFANSSFKLAFGTINSAGTFSAFSTSEVSNSDAWSTNYSLTNNSSLQAQLQISANQIISSNVISSNIANATLSAISATLPSTSIGTMISANKYAFGSQITLSTSFSHPTINANNSNQITDKVTYAWYANGQLISDATTTSYTIPHLFENTTYKVVATWSWYSANNQQDVHTQTLSNTIALIVDDSNVSLILSDNSSTQKNVISTLGNQALSIQLSALFDEGKVTQNFTNTDFANTSMQIQYLYKPSSDSSFSELSQPINASEQSAWSYSYFMQSPTSFEAILTNTNSSITIISNEINTNITAATLSPIQAKVAANNEGKAISSTEFAFGSQVTLTANLVHSNIDATNNEQVTDTVIYAWYANNKLVATTNQGTYSPAALFQNTTYKVQATWTWYVGNNKQDAKTQTFSNEINLTINYANVSLVLSVANATNNTITTLGYQNLSVSLNVNFGNSTTSKQFTASQFAGTDFAISFGTLTNNNFSAFATNEATDASGWSSTYFVDASTQLQAEFKIDSTNIIKSNVIATNLATPAVKLTASVSSTKNAVGSQIAANEFAFGSQVELSASFTHPTITSSTGITNSSNLTYTWYKNGTIIKGVNSSTYIIPCLLKSDTYSVSVNWSWNSTKNDATAITTTNLASQDQTYTSSNLTLTVNNGNIEVTLSDGNSNSTITSSTAQDLSVQVNAKFTNNTISIPDADLLSNFANWKINYQRYAFNQWNNLNSNSLSSDSAFSYSYIPTGIYPIQAILITNNDSFSSNIIKVNTTYNGDVLGLVNIPSSLQSKYNYLTFIQNYLVTSLTNEGSNSPFMQLVNSWTNGFKMIENTKPTNNETSVPVVASDFSNFQVTWTNSSNNEDGVIASATVANPDGLSLMAWDGKGSESYYGDSGSITLKQGDIIKWLLPFGTSSLTWTVTNKKATANYQINSSLTPYPFTSLSENGQDVWEVYNSTDAQVYGYPSLPSMSSYYWGFTAQTANGTDLLTSAIKANSFYQQNMSNDTQWIVYGSFPLLCTNQENPAIIFNSSTSTYAQALYDLSIAGINSLN